jgi:hypothetical protein
MIINVKGLDRKYPSQAFSYNEHNYQTEPKVKTTVNK